MCQISRESDRRQTRPIGTHASNFYSTILERNVSHQVFIFFIYFILFLFLLYLVFNLNYWLFSSMIFLFFFLLLLADVGFSYSTIECLLRAVEFSIYECHFVSCSLYACGLSFSRVNTHAHAHVTCDRMCPCVFGCPRISCGSRCTSTCPNNMMLI